MYNLKREPPWFFHHFENYYHIFVDIRFNNKYHHQEEIKFAIELDVQGFEGLLFYMYKTHNKKLKFGLYNHSIDQVHDIKDLTFKINGDISNTLDFLIIPFGYFKDEHKFKLFIKTKKFEPSYDIHAWTPSYLFKNIKSVIKIANQYAELIPIDDFKGYYYQVDRSFKGNETGRLFDLINFLVELDKSIDEITNESLFEPMDRDIKALVTKSNEFLFELCQRSFPLDLKNIIRELERLKFNVDNLTKEEIFNWLDNLIDFYSEKP